jgi:arylsulfatase A-like enzyme
MDGSRILPRGKVLALAASVGMAVAAAAQAPVPAAEPAPVRATNVMVISIDGLRPDAIERGGARNLQRLMREGAWSLRAETILPSKTLPSHTSMLTGVTPEVHGITWNEDESGHTGTVGVPTIFDLAEARGMQTAAFFGKAKFRHLVRPGGAPGVRSAPRGAEVYRAGVVTQQVEQHLRFRKPRLLFVHLADPDQAGHRYGWMSLPYRMAVRSADAAVGRLVEAAERAYGGDVLVIVTADHGGHGHGHGSEAEEDVQIPWIAWGRGVGTGEVQDLVRTMDTAATALWVLGVPFPESWAGRPVAAAFGDGPLLAGPRDSARTGTGGPLTH